MGTYKELKQRVRREQQLVARLRLATTRLAGADRERIWAIVAAHEAGLSIRKIAAATGLSSSRVHQLLQSKESRKIPVWLSQLREPELVDEDALTQLSVRLLLRPLQLKASNILCGQVSQPSRTKPWARTRTPHCREA